MVSHELQSARDLDLQLAEKVYRSLLPKRLTTPGIDVVSRVRPFDQIGGDYATVFSSADDKVHVCVCDAPAHGISSALLVTRIDGFVRERMPSASHPCEIVEALNAFVGTSFGELAMFPSFFAGTVDLLRMEFNYAGCGHPPALHFKASPLVEMKLLESQQMLLGISPTLSQQCHMNTIRLDPGDRIILYTDGIPDATNGQGEVFGVDRLIQVLGRCVAQNLDGELLADRVFDALERFQGGRRTDDELLMVVAL